jgi:imidazolonepropionase-like amidohydrolase
MWNFEVRRRAQREPRAPHVAVAGPLISSVERPALDLGDPPIVKVTDPDAARAMVRAQLAASPDLVKIWFIAGSDADVVAFTPVVRAVVEAAHAGGVRVAVHATALSAARAAVLAGADLLVHSVTDTAVDDGFVRLLRDRRVILIPTLFVSEGYARVFAGRAELDPLERRFGSPDAIATWAELPDPAAIRARGTAALAALPGVAADNLRRLVAGGVVIAAGSDAGNIGTLHGAGFHRELARMREAGMSCEQVLLSATRDAARVFARQPSIGTLAAGNAADFLVLRADPLVDLAALAAVERVVVNGILYRPDDLVPPPQATGG